MEKEIYTLMMDVLELTPDALEQNLDNKEIWDSLQRVEILFAIEEEYGIQFDEKELVELTTPRALCRVVMQKAE